MAKTENMKMNQVKLQNHDGDYSVVVPLKKAVRGEKQFTLGLYADEDMNREQYGKVCAYVRRALKAYRENGGE